MNLLFTSVGRRTKLIEYFKRELQGINGKVVTTDCSNLAPALYVGDEYYIVPKIDDPSYVDRIKEICEKENIKGVISLIDPELSLLSANKEMFKSMGIEIIVSSYDACELWLDKKATSEFCRENSFNFAKTYSNFEDFKKSLDNKEIDFPVFIKPQRGSASLNINKVYNLEQAEVVFNSSNDLIIQEFLDGQELGIDVYVDMISKEIISIFIKEKLVMRAGETDKARSLKSEKLFELIKSLVKKSGLIGPIDIDVFDVNGDYYISEINPRFGGGYPLAYECNENFPRFLVNNLLGNVNEINIGSYEENIFMMKHDSLEIKKGL